MSDWEMGVSEKIRIGHVLGWLHFGGKENGIVNLVNSLDSDLFENYIFSFVKSGPLADRIIPDRCRVLELGDKLGGDYRLYLKLAREFRKHRIHIAHTHSWATLLEGVVGAKLAGVPIIVHGEHGTIRDDSRMHLYVQSLFWRIADQVLSVSETLRESLHRSVGFPKERIRVIANGVDISRFDVPTNKGDYKLKLGLPASAVTVGAIGRFVPVKCFPVLLQAAEVIFGKIPNACLVVVGDGPLYEELAAIVRKRNIAERIKFLGWRADVPEILKALDIFVLSSESEGMSNTILEAMASAVPVVATAVGGNTELVVDGETGVLVPPNNAKALAEASVTLLRDPTRRARMGELARARVKEFYSLESMTQNYSTFYLEMFSQRFKLSQPLQTKLYRKSLAVQ